MSNQSAVETMHRVRTFLSYARSQPQTGWSRGQSRNGNLQLTAMAGAGV